jgi:hypothetical protein
MNATSPDGIASAARHWPLIGSDTRRPVSAETTVTAAARSSAMASEKRDAVIVTSTSPLR